MVLAAPQSSKWQHSGPKPPASTCEAPCPPGEGFCQRSEGRKTRLRSTATTGPPPARFRDVEFRSACKALRSTVRLCRSALCISPDRNGRLAPRRHIPIVLWRWRIRYRAPLEDLSGDCRRIGVGYEQRASSCIWRIG